MISILCTDNLAENNLSGTLHTEMGWMKALQVFDLRECFLVFQLFDIPCNNNLHVFDMMHNFGA